VNAAGDIVDPSSGKVIAGMRSEDGKSLVDVRTLIRSGALGRTAAPSAGNTTIAVVATNAKLTKAEVSRVALMADDALARAINPSHTTGDGDTVFALATGRLTGTVNPSLIGALAADALAEAIVRAVSTAEPLGGLPSARSIGTAPARVR
jgi:L-aminopeptidase/D-esterase-like protein